MSIFVSIAAYRDPQLGPTVRDCLAKARYPDELRFGICWQRGPEEAELACAADPRFRVHQVDWRESRGVCWARSEIMRLWQGEDFFLQLDSHHRFAQDWDAKLLAHYARTGTSRAILSAYAPAFTPSDGQHPDVLTDEPLQLNFDRFTEDGIVLFRPGVIPNWQRRDRPVRARFLSAHFLFAPGQFVEDVPYDPDLYFHGEEITLAIRAFTHGYDFFHPADIIVWHEYTRAYRTKHWADHVKANGVETEWHERDAASKARVRHFLQHPEEWTGPFGCGTVRTFADYEAYSGLSFKHRKVQEYTRLELEPPNPPAEPDWAERTRRYRVPISVPVAALTPAGREDPHFWYVGFHDANDQEIYRQDVDEVEVRALLQQANDTGTVRIERTFESDREPVSWTVWPVSRSRGWLDKFVQPVPPDRPTATLVTALLDIGRERLEGPFARSFEGDDLRQLERLLATELPLVIYLDPRHEPLVWRHRQAHNTQVIPLRAEDLRAFPHFDRVQSIRLRPEWTAQAAWLPYSPQAALELYNPLVMSKVRWLREQARANPFRTDRHYWIDAGLARTVGDEPLRDPCLAERLAQATGERFLCVSFPYRGGAEVHGFPRAALAHAAGVVSVDHVVRGGFFGGGPQAIETVAELYEDALSRTLAEGHMGTEESVLTILSFRHPECFARYSVQEDGLLGAFFDDLRAGTLRRAAEPPNGSRDDTDDTYDGEDSEVARVGHTRFFGLTMMQNRRAPWAWDELLRHIERTGTPPARIIQLGTGLGGLSVLLQLYCLQHQAQLIVYDTHAGDTHHALFTRLQIDRRVREPAHPFVESDIAREIQTPGVSLVLCDGTNKVHDVDTFADYLKPGDLICVHDYAPSRELFERDLNGRVWSWCEITDAQVRPARERNRLEPVLAETMLAAAWGGWVKRGEQSRRPRYGQGPRLSRVGLYVLGYNAPLQFQAWLDSVRQAAPELLETTAARVLLNNSTDASTFEAYDALCERYGFSQLRRGNLGINGGRVWCARHFHAETDCDAMLYFEDDMLLHPPGDGWCTNGFRTWVPALLECARDIVHYEDLDLLKLSFTEFFGDHTQNWASVNLGEAERAQYFPDGSQTRIEAIRSYRGISYALGEVHYSNWPMLITRRGNQRLFIDDPNVPLYEQLFMVRALKLERAGQLRGGVLLASPIHHQRIHHYSADERREC